MMHESPPFLQCCKPIIEIMAICKRVVIIGDDDALIQNSFAGLMEFCLDGFMELQTFHIVVQFLDIHHGKLPLMRNMHHYSKMGLGNQCH
jgi:hypothetical protein